MTKRETRKAVREVIAGHAESLMNNWEYVNKDFEYGDPRLTTDEAIDIAAEEIDRLFKFFKVD